MLAFLPRPLLGMIVGFLIVGAITLSAILILLASPLKIVSQLWPASARFTRLLMSGIQENWTSMNACIFKLLPPIHWDLRENVLPKKDTWYFVIANHQTWVDILASFHVLNRRVPPLKYFLKQELFYVPIIGLAVYALDYPFMKRYSREFLAKHPHLRGKDLETTRIACEKYQHYPVSVLNFLEGTRRTPEKHRQTQSPYRHLLKPKSAGAAFVLSALGKRMDCMLDITIAYPGGVPSFWDLCCGRVQHIVIDIETRPIPEEYCQGKYEDDPIFRDNFQLWIGSIWEEKDNKLEQILNPPQNV
jgi:1-acyl-sn-glycerol-3-phosphate acyltransferase